MRPLFADPKTDFVFRKIFGTEEHKPLLIALLNGLLELDEAHRAVEVELLSPEQRPAVQGLKNSIVDVRCVDARGTRYVVEMQVLNVEGFEKRVVYNVAKAYTAQLEAGQPYPELNDVVGVTVCDFHLWPPGEGVGVPMLSRWRMQEQHGGALGLGQVQFVFLELPKYDATRLPVTAVEKWAYFFREAPNLQVVPEVLAEQPFRDALEAARAAGFNEEEWEAYLRANMAIQDERGALSLAVKQGRAEGRAEGWAEGQLESLRTVIRETFERRGWVLSDRQEALLAGCKDLEMLKRWLAQSFTASSPAGVLADSASTP
ncbi:MAG TPA: Rpn family recombination-promoting nuclease/putative transposase [Hyalangium sp.]|jgi:predicted transposase/invertase (TIGR01784 family)|nr:Rpn family recombination-promoting nuclease/putative transposase [Hyalangium sp.]